MEDESVIKFQTDSLVPRLCLLLMLVTALGGCWVVEQPELSVLEFFPPYQTLLAALYQASGGTAVTLICIIKIHIFLDLTGSGAGS